VWFLRNLSQTTGMEANVVCGSGEPNSNGHYPQMAEAPMGSR
jgi:hypothetical protein